MTGFFSSDHGGQGGRSDEAPRGSEEEGGVPYQGNQKFLIFILIIKFIFYFIFSRNLRPSFSTAPSPTSS